MEILILVWIVCAVFNYGLVFAHFQGTYTMIAKKYYYNDMVYAIFVSLFGPIALIMTFIVLDIKQGWRYK